MKENIKFSIVTVSYNQGEFIEDNIKSVLSQNYSNFEHIIVDGGSTDNTLEILNRYSHLKWVSEKDNGQSEALNKGIKMATGDVIVWINSDDLLYSNALNIASKLFEEEEYVGISGALTYIDENSNEIGRTDSIFYSFNDLLNKKISVNQPSTFIKREAILSVGSIDQSLHYAMDYDLFLKLLYKNYKFKKTDQCLACFRFQSNSKTTKGKINFFKEIRKIRKMYNNYTSKSMDIYVNYNIIKSYIKYKLAYYF